MLEKQRFVLLIQRINLIQRILRPFCLIAARIKWKWETTVSSVCGQDQKHKEAGSAMLG